jgi:hypothetical protein
MEQQKIQMPEAIIYLNSQETQTPKWNEKCGTVFLTF